MQEIDELFYTRFVPIRAKFSISLLADGGSQQTWRLSSVIYMISVEQVCLGNQINNSRQLLAAYCAGTVDLVSDMHPDMGLMSQAERAFRQTWRLKGMEVILFHLRMSRILSSPITMDVRRKARQREGHWKTRADFAG